MSIDLSKARAATRRWYIMLALDAGRPGRVSEDLILRALQDLESLAQQDLRRELDYLRDHKLVTVDDKLDPWLAELTGDGVDFVEYNAPDRPGIARPPRRRRL